MVIKGYCGILRSAVAYSSACSLSYDATDGVDNRTLVKGTSIGGPQIVHRAVRDGAAIEVGTDAAYGVHHRLPILRADGAHAYSYILDGACLVVAANETVVVLCNAVDGSATNVQVLNGAAVEVAEDAVVRIACGADGDTIDGQVVAIEDALEISALGAIVVEVGLIGAAVEGEVGVQLEVLVLVAVLLGTFVAVYLNNQLCEFVLVIDEVWTLLRTCAVPERIGGTDSDIIAGQHKGGSSFEEGTLVTGLFNDVCDVLCLTTLRQRNGGT